MKKVSLLTLLFTLLFILTACGSGSASTNNVGGGTVSTNSFRSGAASTPLNPESKLALGTIKLEGTKQAVDPKMASSLVPLWQLLFQLNSTSSSAPQEVTAVVDQIRTTMTPEQLKTIDSMTLTQADIFTAFQQANGSGGTTGATGGNRGGGFVFVGGGGFPGGGGPGAGGFPGGGGAGGFTGGGNRTNSGTGSTTTTTASSAQATAQAAQARQNATSNLLINQLIKLLEAKLSS